MNSKIILSAIFFVVLLQTSHAQRRATGAILDPVTIAATPKKVALSYRSFRGLPEAVSLEKYCPTPGDQGNHGTCVAFANGYGLATILYARTHNITDKKLIDKYAFSPTYLYEKIKSADDRECQNGTDPIKAIFALIDSGDALLSTVPYLCGSTLSFYAQLEASLYRATDIAVLFAAPGVLTSNKYEVGNEEVINNTKKALIDGSPVSTGFYLPESFFRIKSAVWETMPGDSASDWQHARHAMLVVGYDDTKYGGAFRVLNSWGTGWGDGGFIWIKYPDFVKWCALGLQAFADPYSPVPEEMKPKPTPEPKPEPEPEPKPQPVPEIKFSLAGDVEFRLNTGDKMEVSQVSTRNLVVEDDLPEADRKEDLVAYKMMNTYSSGTKFRFYISTDDEAYIYAFATDLTGKVNRILPFDDLMSTHIGAKSVVAFPSDTKVVKMDEQKGTDYMLILYSKEKLDATAIAAAMSNIKGGLSKKMKAALGGKLIEKNKIKYYTDRPGFSVSGKRRNPAADNDKPQEDDISGTVVPLMVEITHL
jgi:hypothetical protein